MNEGKRLGKLCCFQKEAIVRAGLLVHGGLDDASVNDSTYNSGGYISVQGFNITVLRNMPVSFPAAYVPWPEFVVELDAMRGYEIQVIGNFVNGEPMAAQISTSQLFESLSSGYIESLNFTEGTMKIRSGPILRISDPNGVFPVGYAGTPFFTADDENPSISSYSGMPMCIPRNSSDPPLPAPKPPFYWFSAVADPLRMVPFLAGDFVTFSGIRRGDEVICYSIVANNVQILTLGTLVYIRMELGLLGIDNLVSTNTELAESRFRGYVSNNRAQIALYAMDIDPCTAAVTDRIIAVVNDFSQMPWLTQGVGVDEHGNLWGPLDPFPQTVVFIEPIDCGPVGRLRYEGDKTDTNWAPSGKTIHTFFHMTAHVFPLLMAEIC
ncbi:hypothetical protein S7711_10896 [Stachybotrys chartarum IBT 7711]|uniref:Uncharacterized protein n=1 Tax=Stachybotrys chartarum (strain CBS 109288 / IBT 7711) TaxID=1280523 RepID=A0A084ASF8_STACB|nr:hypothetical protein S7711_10896 [Stachybotrys chartarum IBT 7711]